MILILDTPRFLLSDLSAALPSLDQNNLKAWIGRGVVSLSEFDREAGGSGKRVLLTLRTAYELALTSRMVELGVSPARAFQNACLFSKRKSLKLKPDVFGGTDERNPETLLYDNRPTCFVIYPQNFDESEHSSHMTMPAHSWIGPVSNSEDEALFDSIFRDGRAAAIVLFCNPILSGVDNVLGVDRG